MKEAELKPNPYQPPKATLRTNPGRLSIGPGLVKAAFCCGLFTFGGLCLGIFTGIGVSALAAMLDPLPRPRGYCGNSDFEFTGLIGIAGGFLWGLWKASRVLVKN